MKLKDELISDLVITTCILVLIGGVAAIGYSLMEMLSRWSVQYPLI